MALLKKYKHYPSCERERILADYAASPLTAQAYAASQGIGFSTLARWRRQIGLSLKKQKKESLTAAPASSSPLPSQKENIFKDLSELFTSPPPSLETALIKPALPPFEGISLEISVPNGLTIKVAMKENRQAAHFIKELL